MDLLAVLEGNQLAHFLQFGFLAHQYSTARYDLKMLAKRRMAKEPLPDIVQVEDLLLSLEGGSNSLLGSG